MCFSGFHRQLNQHTVEKQVRVTWPNLSSSFHTSPVPHPHIWTYRWHVFTAVPPCFSPHQKQKHTHLKVTPCLSAWHQYLSENTSRRHVCLSVCLSAGVIESMHFPPQCLVFKLCSDDVFLFWMCCRQHKQKAGHRLVGWPWGGAGLDAVGGAQRGVWDFVSPMLGYRMCSRQVSDHPGGQRGLWFTLPEPDYDLGHRPQIYKWGPQDTEGLLAWR